MNLLAANLTLVRSHSLASPGCDANALRSLWLRTPEQEDGEWEATQKRAQEQAATAEHSDVIEHGKWRPWPF